MRSRLVALSLALSLFVAACNTSGSSGGGSRPALPPAAGGAVQFISTQFNTVDETTKMNNDILKNAPVPTNFQPSELGPFNDRLTAEEKAGKVTVGVVGGQHGDFAPFVVGRRHGRRHRSRPAALGPQLPAKDSRPEQVRHRQELLRAVGAGDLRAGGQQEGAAVPAPGRRRQRAHATTSSRRGAPISPAPPASARSASRTARRACSPASSRATCTRRTPARPASSPSRAPKR